MLSWLLFYSSANLDIMVLLFFFLPFNLINKRGFHVAGGCPSNVPRFQFKYFSSATSIFNRSLSISPSPSLLSPFLLSQFSTLHSARPLSLHSSTLPLPISLLLLDSESYILLC